MRVAVAHKLLSLPKWRRFLVRSALQETRRRQRFFITGGATVFHMPMFAHLVSFKCKCKRTHWSRWWIQDQAWKRLTSTFIQQAVFTRTLLCFYLWSFSSLGWKTCTEIVIRHHPWGCGGFFLPFFHNHTLAVALKSLKHENDLRDVFFFFNSEYTHILKQNQQITFLTHQCIRCVRAWKLPERVKLKQSFNKARCCDVLYAERKRTYAEKSTGLN